MAGGNFPRQLIALIREQLSDGPRLIVDLIGEFEGAGLNNMAAINRVVEQAVKSPGQEDQAVESSPPI